ncbi:MAG: HAMP domain-containing histidine kinase [Bacteroidia bacterium]|nr:HAMP domain-containing histidine kinase [Bacteroidia bacterium]
MRLNIQWIRDFFILSKEEQDIYNHEIVLINTQRTLVMCVVGMILTLANIFSFAQNIEFETGLRLVWRQNVIVVHATVFIIAFVCFVYILIKRKLNGGFVMPSKVVVNVIQLTIVLAGILLAIIDQMLGMGIYAFLLVIIALGVVYYIRPLNSLLIYTLAITLFYFGIGLEQIDRDVLLNARVNGVSFGLIGLGLSFIFWRLILKQIKLTTEVNRQNEELIEQHSEKDRLFSILAHDLKGPMGSFLSLTEVMAQDSNEHDKEELVEMSKALNRSSKKLYSLLENLLSYSRAKLQILQLKPVKIDLLYMGNECISQYEELAKNKGIILNLDIPQNVELVTDAFMLQTIMRNLIANAIKFCKNGDTISIKSTFTDANYICISVEDTGIGMSEDMLGSLFKVGVKGRLGTKGESTSGLGLLLCQELIQKMNGRIEVTSKENKGTNFFVYLPK